METLFGITAGQTPAERTVGMIADRENALFERWRARYPNAVADGVVDEGAYGVSTPRLLFVLKEVNDPGGGGWDLREYLSANANGRTASWDNVARWVVGIRRRGEDLPWPELRSLAGKRRQDVLRSIAVMNVKKTPGGNVTNADELAAAAGADAALLREQAALYAPDLVLCCGSSVAKHFEHVCYDASLDWKETVRGVSYAALPGGARLLDLPHPEARLADAILYYAVVDAVRAVLPMELPADAKRL